MSGGAAVLPMSSSCISKAAFCQMLSSNLVPAQERHTCKDEENDRMRAKKSSGFDASGESVVSP